MSGMLFLLFVQSLFQFGAKEETVGKNFLVNNCGQNESYTPQLFTRKFSPREPKCLNRVAVEDTHG